jgi:dienelactone hydrolase
MRIAGLCCLLLVVVSVARSQAAGADSEPSTTGVVKFAPVGDESALPEQFRLAPHTFRYERQPLPTRGSVMTVSRVTFPSPVVTPHPNNNTVHCEYFCPTAGGTKPGVVVLHILGGDFDLARLFCRALATRGTAALFLKMPYYGERRQEGSSARMISMDPHETARGMTQAVLDVRQAAGWLAAQDEIDGGQIGILGISLGGITAALATSIEPRITKACLILAGGDMGEVAWQSTELTELRERWTAGGHTKQELFELLRPVDPVTYARPVAGRKILMLNASQDEVVPPACTKALWRAFGEPEIVWWEAGHYTALRYLFSGAARAVDFFQSDAAAAAQSTAK